MKNIKWYKQKVIKEFKNEPFAIFMIGLVVGVLLMGIGFLIG